MPWIVAGAFLVEGAIGWPRRLSHPVVWVGGLIATLERRWNRQARLEPARRRLGVVTVLILVFLAGGAGWGVERLAAAAALWPGVLLVVVCGATGLAARSLCDHVRAIARPLTAGDLPQARHAVSMIVGRDVDAMDEGDVARAALESLAESFCDGVSAPLFWLLTFGLPGVWCYKAINTADSLIGHREPQWRAFGWAAARIDDIANLAPARLGGVILCLAGLGGWRVMARDHGRHASPNAGWTEAAMAGALNLRLAGPIAYDGVVAGKPWIGSGRVEADAADIRRALRLYRRACLILWGVAAAVWLI